METRIDAWLACWMFTSLTWFATASRTAAQAPPPLQSVVVGTGLNSPTYLTHAPGDGARVFVTEQQVNATGRVRVLNLANNLVNAQPYLEVGPVGTSTEQGLLGLAFDPNFASNGHLFVYFTNAGGDNQIVRYTANVPYTTSTTADPLSAYPIVTFLHPGAHNHNGGWIDFGPDGMLYVATGDAASGANSQDMGSFLGKLLRIDVDTDGFPADPRRNYGVPATNPFVGVPGTLGEIWHYGLRNPWRDSFDRATGDLWIADVGNTAVEEVDFVPAGLSGRNFGWPCTEGTSCTGSGACTCNDPALTAPVHTYTHTGGACSIIGGYRYRGSALCGWDGAYFFADYCSDKIYSFGFNGSTITSVTNLTPQLFVIPSISSFGEDDAGELYVVSRFGTVRKIVLAGSNGDCNGNGVRDACDIWSGTSVDANADGIPDECQPVISAFCFGDGTGTTCPCGAGVAGAGCPNSVNTAGASLVGSGYASIIGDSFQLNGSGMPNGPCLYFQGTVQLPSVNPGAGVIFGDGLRCVGGVVIRLGIKTNLGGASQIPELLDPGIAATGGLSGGPLTRYYQCWYRDSAIGFCNPEVYNLTNGVATTWVP